MMKCRGVAAVMLAALCGTASAQGNFASQFPARILATHNAERAQVGLPGVVWDPTLAAGAAAYAQQMALTNVFQHSDRKARPGIGENLWMGTRGAYSVERMVGGWASEKRYFLPGIFPNNSRSGNWMDVGHYTQMIWAPTQRIGCAIASNGRTDYLVCRYSPKGNVDGKWVGPMRAERG
jgi:hypothetical protein